MGGNLPLPTTVSGHVRIGKGTDEVPSPAHYGGPLDDCPTSNVEALPSVNTNASDECAQVVQAECLTDHNVELTQTQSIDDSAN